jgi:hypothetical protein
MDFETNEIPVPRAAEAAAASSFCSMLGIMCCGADDAAPAECSSTREKKPKQMKGKAYH